MKKIIYLSGSLLFFASCASMKKSSSPTSNSVSEKRDSGPRFIETIKVNPEATTTSTSTSRSVYKPAPVAAKSSTGLQAIENCNSMQFKYSILMNMPVEALSNEKLFSFLDEWYGTPYRYGGSTKSGVDCSAFTCFFMTAVYGITLPRNSRDQYASSMKIRKNELAEGDLVFFKTRSTISHVGVYLGNNKFAHASTSSGVMISDLDEEYFSKRYAGSGRVKQLN